jgi:hypothetical protein
MMKKGNLFSARLPTTNSGHSPLQKTGKKAPLFLRPDSYPHFTNPFCERAWQGNSYCSDQQNLCFVDPLVKVLLKDVGKNQLFKTGMNGPTFRGVMGEGFAPA